MKATGSVWVGRVLTGLFALFILGASATPKLLGMPVDLSGARDSLILQADGVAEGMLS